LVCRSSGLELERAAPAWGRRSVKLDKTGKGIGFSLGETHRCQYRLKIPHSAGRKVCHPPEKMVESFSRLVENETGW
jgi:hypothetical protein